MATVAEITHDSSTTIGDFYDTVTDVDGALTVTPAAALNFSTNGVNIDFDAGNNSSELIKNISSTTTEYRFRFRVNMANTTNSNAGVTVATWEIWGSPGNNPTAFVDLNANSGDSGYHLKAYYTEDGKGAPQVQIGSGEAAISSTEEVCIELSVLQNGVNDADFDLLIDGVSAKSVTGVSSVVFTSISSIEIPIFTNEADISGDMYYDEYIIDDTYDASGLCVDADPPLSLAAMNKPADVDASGTFIYVALLEGGTPILTKISTALNADGTTVFDPGAGDNIGVECGRFNADVVWVGGNFDGTNVVEKSEDAGSSFVVKDDATIGDVRAFVMGPDSDDKILLFDETNGDILETRDDGASWISINAAVTPEINAIARLGKNVQESVFGNQGAANDSINYSVNSGDDLEDFQTGPYPNANATRVIIN